MTELKFDEFLLKYKITEENFEKTGYSWDQLLDINNHYLSIYDQLEVASDSVYQTIKKFPKVHSVRVRVKDPEHLIEKIIRKKIEDPSKEVVTIDNYLEQITDLVGVRPLHLYKDDWIEIHDKINECWNLHEEVTAYHREGDDVSIYNNCQTKVHKKGYRSVHYIIKTQPNKISILCEIQVRTIYEEAWSEIDHQIRYPYDQDNELLGKYLMILNRLSGGADEMGSFISYLKNHLLENQENVRNADLENKKLLKELNETIDKLSVETEEKEKFKIQLENLRRNNEVKLSSSSVSSFNNNEINRLSKLGVVGTPLGSLSDYTDTVIKLSSSNSLLGFSSISPAIKLKKD